MVIKYYKNKQLAFATRNRFKDISKFAPINPNGEVQRSIKLGNGSRTSVKTSASNICDYVTIDSTRWFVVDYVYLNGGQVKLNLQRDVVGEFGLDGCYGKIERGFTNSVIKYRKELSLNEVLKRRTPLIPTDNIYGKCSVNTHDGEMWGILYFTKEDKPKTTINISGFVPAYEPVGSLPPTTIYTTNCEYRTKQEIMVTVANTNQARAFMLTIRYRQLYSDNVFQLNEQNIVELPLSSLSNSGSVMIQYSDNENLGADEARSLVSKLGNLIKNAYGNTGITAPSYIPNIGQTVSGSIPTTQTINYSTDGGETIVEYSLTRENAIAYGDIDYEQFQEYIFGLNSITLGAYDVSVQYLTPPSENGDTGIKFTAETAYEKVFYETRELTEWEEGNIVIDNTIQLVDEPYVILVCPLYNVTVTEGTKSYVIEQRQAFHVFNSVIEKLSGEVGTLVDAQIFPYCPDLDKAQTFLATEGGGQFPFFSVLTTSFKRTCSVQLQPLMDVKKEYIERNYSIVSPDKTGKFTFNFYDYVNAFESVDGGNADINYMPLKIIIKTALKPFAIISSAVIQRVECIKGINYDANLEGCQPSSNGFECSLSSNAFETYKRQNSNYQQIFKLDVDELTKNQEVERVNEATQLTMNVLTQTAFGAIAGAQLGDIGMTNWAGSKAAGALTGGSVAALATGIAGGIQLDKNDELREYEQQLIKQRFDLSIGTIKNMPNSINRISSFNELIMQEFYYVVETYECTDAEKEVVDNFISNYGYGIGVYEYFDQFHKDGWFLRGVLLKSTLPITLHELMVNDLGGGVYLNE